MINWTLQAAPDPVKTNQKKPPIRHKIGLAMKTHNEISNLEIIKVMMLFFLFSSLTGEDLFSGTGLTGRSLRLASVVLGNLMISN